MDVLIWLVPTALGLGLTWLLAFLWSLHSNQYDDLEGAALRILQDDDLPDDRRKDSNRTGAAVHPPAEPAPPPRDSR